MFTSVNFCQYKSHFVDFHQHEFITIAKGSRSSLVPLHSKLILVAFVEDSATMSSTGHSENHVSYLGQNRRK